MRYFAAITKCRLSEDLFVQRVHVCGLLKLRECLELSHEPVDLYAHCRLHREADRQGPSQITAETSLEEAGIDSFDFIELVFQIEEEFGIHVDHNQNDVASRLKSVGDIAALIDELVAAKSGKTTDSPNEAA